MKNLRQHLSEYVAARRALGTRLEEAAHALGQFVSFLARKRVVSLPSHWLWNGPSNPRMCSVQHGPESCRTSVSLLAG